MKQSLCVPLPSSKIMYRTSFITITTYCYYQKFDPSIGTYLSSSLPLLIRPSSFSSSHPLFLKPISYSIAASSFPPPSPSSFSLTTAQSRRNFATPVTMLHHNPLVSDVYASAISGAVAFSFLKLWQETAKHGLFDQKLNRKLVHISIGLVFMICWPLFSTDGWGPYLASLIPGMNIIRMLGIGLGLWKDEATVKSMSRFGDCRELLKGPLYYAAAITLASVVYWRTSPISIALICNLCAGDGMADIVGRRLGGKKIPYNKNKSFAGSIAMASSGFLASIAYMCYFSSFGYIEGSLKLVLGFLVVSIATAIVESLPISTELDDNLTVSLTSVLVGSVIL